MSTDALLANMDCEREELRAFSAEKEHRQDCGCFEHCDYIINGEIMSPTLIITHFNVSTLRKLNPLF